MYANKDVVNFNDIIKKINQDYRDDLSECLDLANEHPVLGRIAFSDLFRRIEKNTSDSTESFYRPLLKTIPYRHTFAYLITAVCYKNGVTPEISMEDANYWLKKGLATIDRDTILTVFRGDDDKINVLINDTDTKAGLPVLFTI